jgi:hypothetical protein
VALAGSGAFAGGGSSPSSDEGSGVTQHDTPGATQSGPTHRGRHCRHEGQDPQAPQQSSQEDPPV